MGFGILVIGFFVVAAFVIGMLIFHYSRARSILDQWAEENGYEIVSSEHRLMGGRFWWRKSRGQEVYYVTIRMSDGQIRRGWVRCGGWFLGTLSNQADVEWDDDESEG
jgi:hypothetical protein